VEGQITKKLTTSFGRRRGAWRVNIFITLKTGYTAHITTVVRVAQTVFCVAMGI
jgi:hypothetical protein